MRGENRPPTVEDRVFMERLYERHKGVMYKVASARLSDPAEVDDVVSEALLRLFRHTGTLRALRPEQLVDYVATTVGSVASDRERRRRTELRLFVSAEDALPGGEPAGRGMEEEFTDQERHAALLGYLREALEELSETDRMLLIGKYIDGESDEALVARLGVKPASMRMKLSRARKRARKIIERKEAGHETGTRQR